MKAMYVGSFDPFTLGHLSIVEKALEKYDELIICIGRNDTKTSMFSLEQRKDFILQSCLTLNKAERINVISNVGLTVDAAQREKVDTLIRGIRNDSADLYKEQQMAETNRFLAAIRGFKLKTDFIVQTDPFLQTVSSSLVRKLIQMKECIAMVHYLPKYIAETITLEGLKPLFISLFKDKSYAHYYWEQLLQTYSHRPQHNLMHIAYMINQLRIYKQLSNDSAAYTPNMFLAIFLHDYVYDVSSKEHPLNNEHCSANIAFSWCNRPIFTNSISAIKVHNLIMATAHASNNNLSDEQKIIADLDLSILGTADTATYNTYADGIRKEYSTYSDEDYKKGRLAFLFTLLKKKHIFHTIFFRDRFEEQARKNITAEIKRLHGKS